MKAKKTKTNSSGKPTNIFPVDYRKSDGVHVPKAGGEHVAYNEGDIPEGYLLDLFKGASDTSIFSREIVRAIRDWSSSYHLSPKRANLLRPFSAILQSRVLEVGAGCGAVTRFLGEIGSDVIAVEGSHRRGLIARERTKDLDNVKIVVDRIQDFSSRELFDVIVVIGVLEYSRVYMVGAAEPEKEFLSHLDRLLTRDGVIILAIENKLGLKYLAGAPEDHFGLPFAGINDAYTADSVVTFGQLELRGLLHQTGFREQRWFIPCPDYKLPTTILSPKIMSGHHELAATLLAQSAILDPQRPNDPSFSLEQAWSVIEKNGLVEQLANSFLVVAGRSRSSLTEIDRDKSIAWHYSTDRHPAFVKQAQFVSQKGGIVVKRSHLQSEPAPPVPLECVIESEPYVDGINWWRALSSIVNKTNWSVRQVADWARVWIDSLLQECKLGEFNGQTFRTFVSGRYFDAAPFNLIRAANGTSHFIDQEWRLIPDVEFGFLVYRGLRDSLVRVTSSAASAANTPANINLLISAVLAELGVMVTKIELDRFSLLEQQVQAWVAGDTADNVPEEFIANIRNTLMRQRAPLDRAQLIKERAAAIAEGEKKIAQISEQLTTTRDASQQLEHERRRLDAELRATQASAGEQKGELDRLAAALEQETAAAARSNAQAALLGRELESLRAAVREHETATINLRADLDKAQLVSNERERERDRLTATLEQEKAAAARNNAQTALLRQELETTRGTVRQYETTIIQLRADLDQAETVLNDGKIELDKISHELNSAQSVIKDRGRENERLSYDLEATRRFLRESQTEIQRLAGELDGARGEAVALGFALEEARYTVRESNEFAVGQTTRIRDLEASLEHHNAENDRLAAELVRTATEIQRIEKSNSDRVAVLQALRTAMLAEIEKKAQTQVRNLRNQLVDAEAALAKVRNESKKGSVWRRLFSESKRRAERRLMDSGLFDVEWYIREYPAVAESGRSPAEHYLEEGYLCGYRPNPLFDTRWYLERYEDVRRAGMNPLMHYLEYGCREGRDPGQEFETDYYLLTYPDVRESGINPLTHYLQYGKAAGRLPIKPRSSS